MTTIQEVLVEITRDIKQIYKRLDDIELTGFQSATGVVPAAGTAFNHLEDNGAAWTSVSILNVGTVAGGGGERLALRTDQDAVTAQEIVNNHAGTAAAALLRVKNTAGAGGDHALGVGVLGTGFTTAGLAIQDSAIIQSGASLSGGLVLRTLAATPLIFGVNATSEAFRVEGTNNVRMATTLDLNGNDLIIDTDGDTYLHEAADDRVDLVLAGASGELRININGGDDFFFTAGRLTIPLGSSILFEDSTPIYFGTGTDVTGGYDAGNSRLEWTGDNWYFNGVNIGVNIAPAAGYGVYSVTTAATAAVYGVETSGIGVFGDVSSGAGMYAKSATGYALVANLTGAGTAIADFQDNGTSRLFVGDGGLVGISETSNAFSTIGLTINQEANTDEILTVKSSTVAHGITDITETDTYGFARKLTADGGLLLYGLTGGSYGAMLIGAGVTDNTTKSTAGLGYVELRAYKKDGTAVGVTGADANLVVIRNYGTTRFIFDAEGTGHADDSWTTFSDRRLKRDIAPIRYGLNEILALEPVNYNRADNGKARLGLIAQDVHGIIPEATRMPPNAESMWSLDSNALVPVLVRAIQELNEKIERLEHGNIAA